MKEDKDEYASGAGRGLSVCAEFDDVRFVGIQGERVRCDCYVEWPYGQEHEAGDIAAA